MAAAEARARKGMEVAVGAQEAAAVPSKRTGEGRAAQNPAGKSREPGRMGKASAAECASEGGPSAEAAEACTAGMEGPCAAEMDGPSTTETAKAAAAKATTPDVGNAAAPARTSAAGRCGHALAANCCAK